MPDYKPAVGVYLTVWAVTTNIKRSFAPKELEIALCVTMGSGIAGFGMYQSRIHFCRT